MLNVAQLESSLVLSRMVHIGTTEHILMLMTQGMVPVLLQRLTDDSSDDIKEQVGGRSELAPLFFVVDSGWAHIACLVASPACIVAQRHAQ